MDINRQEIFTINQGGQPKKRLYFLGVIYRVIRLLVLLNSIDSYINFYILGKTQMEIQSGQCHLCDSDSRFSETDSGNRYLVDCLSETCGKYEITKATITKIEGVEGLRSELKALVNKHSSESGYYDFSTNLKNGLSCVWRTNI